MAGPAFNILLRDPLTVAQSRELDAWLKTFTGGLETGRNVAGEPDEWFFYVNDPSPLGLQDRFSTCMIGLVLVELWRELEEDEEEQIMRQLGFWPVYGINVYAMCKNFSTGLATSYLILRLLERFNGYLDFCMRERMPLDEMDTEQNFPGKSYVIRYRAPDPQDAYHSSCWWEGIVIDAEHLRWWLRDENSVLPGFCIE